MTYPAGTHTDTIVALATPAGRGGVSIVRVSGPLAKQVATRLCGQCPPVRYAAYTDFISSQGLPLDQGIALYFQGPHSFTGEDVFEIQGHGGPVIVDLIIQDILSYGDVRLAKPGEFSEQAFMNDKLDLTQAEAIADLINTTSEKAALMALQSLKGEFSHKINELVERVIHLRVFVEAAIDFPDEEIDFLSDGHVLKQLQGIIDQLHAVEKQAQQGAIMREGMRVVIAGKPNAGKSSLLNALSGKDTAIVTDIEGTTRDVLREMIQIDGMPLHIIDTAGLRESPDKVEQIGIERAWAEIEQADRILLMVDSSTTDDLDPTLLLPGFYDKLPKHIPITMIRNKIDQTQEQAGFSTFHYEESTSEQHTSIPVIRLSATSHQGLDTLKEHLKDCMGLDTSVEGSFMARRRHLTAIEKAKEHLYLGLEQLEVYAAGELLAEELRLTQDYLSEITGQFTNDDLLTEIFSSFCIGK